MRKQGLIKGTIIGMFVLIGLGVFITRPESSRAANDDVLEAISGYKSWGRVTKEPFKVIPFSRNDKPDIPPKDEVDIEGFRVENLMV